MWIDLKTGLIAKLHADIRNMRPNWSAPNALSDDDIAAQGFAPVTLVTPVYDPVNQAAIEQPPKLVGGVWTQQWTITALDAATAAANLAAAVAVKNSAINDWREQANLTTFTHGGKAVACDPLSRSDIDGVANSIALFGAFPANFPGAWKAVDNSYIVMASIDDFKAMYASMTAQGSANFAKAQSLKAKLANAKTQADLDAITWTAKP